MPSRQPPRPATQDLVCPKCGEGSFAERASFKAASEPLMGAQSASVVVDLMSCKHCGFDLPAVRGRRRFALVQSERLSRMLAELDEERRRCAEIQGVLDGMARQSQRLEVEIERSRVRGEISVIEGRVTALESETVALEATRARLAVAVTLVASRAQADRAR